MWIAGAAAISVDSVISASSVPALKIGSRAGAEGIFIGAGVPRDMITL
jgi:hypothetical protein